MKTFFFGPEDRRLFGVRHQPDAPRGRAVVLCYPHGHEYAASLRSYRRLAALLARAGVDVLRFDYFGTGDSAGDDHEGTLETWVADVLMAAEWLREAGGHEEVSLMGLRLGATLAALAARRRNDVDALVLWNPVWDGAAYLVELRHAHAEWVAAGGRAGLIEESGSAGEESVGLTLPADLIAELERLRLGDPGGAARRLLYVSQDGPTGSPARNGRQPIEEGIVTRMHFDGPRPWIRDPSAVTNALVPARLLSAVIHWYVGSEAA